MVGNRLGEKNLEHSYRAMKMRAAHTVPLVDDVLTLLKDLPRFDCGDHLFSTTFGATPVNGFSKAKKRIDAVMPKTEPWVLHDIRRTFRTNLSALRVPDTVAELCIGHLKKGLHRIYDQHSFLDEKAEALDRWSHRLRDIVSPPPASANVVRMRKGR